MTDFQRVIKYLANVLAVFLIVLIIGGILKIVGIFGFIANRETPVGESKSYSISQTAEKLDIEISAAKLTVKQGEIFFVESNLKNLKVEEKNGTLSIKDTKTFLKTYTNAYVTLFVPSGFEFSNVNIQTGAGAFEAENLLCDKLYLNLGAGSVNISSLTAKDNAKIEGGAGEIKIDGGEINNLDLEMGVGELDITSKLTGKNELHFGVGEAKINLIGNDYKIDFDKGIGEGTLNGAKINSDTTYGAGNNIIDIEGGIGSVDIDFIEIKN